MYNCNSFITPTEHNTHKHRQAHTHTHQHTYARRDKNSLARTRVRIHTGIHTHTYTLRTHIHVHTQTHTRTHAYTQKHTHEHKHIHTCGAPFGQSRLSCGAPCGIRVPSPTRATPSVYIGMQRWIREGIPKKTATITWRRPSDGWQAGQRRGPTIAQWKDGRTDHEGRSSRVARGLAQHNGPVSFAYFFYSSRFCLSCSYSSFFITSTFYSVCFPSATFSIEQTHQPIQWYPLIYPTYPLI